MRAPRQNVAKNVLVLVLLLIEAERSKAQGTTDIVVRRPRHQTCVSRANWNAGRPFTLSKKVRYCTRAHRKSIFDHNPASNHGRRAEEEASAPIARRLIVLPSLHKLERYGSPEYVGSLVVSQCIDGSRFRRRR
jgi:hypothetical protein